MTEGQSSKGTEGKAEIQNEIVLVGQISPLCGAAHRYGPPWVCLRQRWQQGEIAAFPAASQKRSKTQGPRNDEMDSCFRRNDRILVEAVFAGATPSQASPFEWLMILD